MHTIIHALVYYQLFRLCVYHYGSQQLHYMQAMVVADKGIVVRHFRRNQKIFFFFFLRFVSLGSSAVHVHAGSSLQPALLNIAS